MDQCTLYLTLPPGENIIALFQDSFPDFKMSGEANGGPMALTKKGFFSSRKISFSWRSTEREVEAFMNSMQGMYNFFAALSTPHQAVRERLLAHLQMINFMAAITAPKEIDDDALGALLGLAGRMGGFVLFPPCDLYTADGTLLMNGDGETELEEYAVTVPSAILDQHVEITESGEKRKQTTNRQLEHEGIPVCESLPPIVGDENAKIRSVKEIAERATGIVMAAIYAEILRDSGDVPASRQKIRSIMAEYDAEQFLSPQERAFIADDAPEHEDIADFLWRYECYWVALWTLGFIENLDFPDSICDVSLAVSFLRDAGSVDAFIEQSVLRGVDEILDEADYIYRCDWACVDARIKRQPAPAGTDAGVVVERHRMLNWITCYLDQDWDDVRTDT